MNYSRAKKRIEKMLGWMEFGETWRICTANGKDKTITNGEPTNTVLFTYVHSRKEALRVFRQDCDCLGKGYMKVTPAHSTLCRHCLRAGVFGHYDANVNVNGPYIAKSNNITEDICNLSELKKQQTKET